MLWLNLHYSSEFSFFIVATFSAARPLTGQRAPPPFVGSVPPASSEPRGRPQPERARGVVHVLAHER